jgi:hypothetical protein
VPIDLGTAIASWPSMTIMRIMTPLKLSLIATIAVACLGFPQLASALTIGDTRELGFIPASQPVTKTEPIMLTR